MRANGQLPYQLVPALVLAFKAFTFTFLNDVKSVSNFTFFKHKLIFSELFNLETVDQTQFLILIDVFE